MAATYSLTRPSISIKDNTSTISECGTTLTGGTTPTGNHNTNHSLTMYPFGGLDQDVLIVKGIETSDCYGNEEHISKPINLPQGYISISSVARRYSADSEDLVASAKYESDFWPPTLNVFSKRRRKVSYAEEAIKVCDELDVNKDDGSSSSQSSEVSTPSSSPFGTPMRISEILTSLPNLSLPKLPERSWFCKSCRKPKDECHCLCVIC